MIFTFPLRWENRALISSNRDLVEQAAYFVRRNTGVTSSLQEGTVRVQRPACPEEAVREAIVNAQKFAGRKRPYSLFKKQLDVATL
jgi:hypothetical protein